MIRIRRHNWLFRPLLATLAILAFGREVRAQDDVVIDEEPAVPVEVVEFKVHTVDLVDQWLFGAHSGAAGMARNKLDLALSMRIDEIGRACELTGAQQQKLRLAGAADIKRFFDRVDDIKRQSPGHDNIFLSNAIPPIAAELQSGLFGDRSFFTKTIKRTLSEAQSAKLEMFIRQRDLSRYHAMLGWYVMQLSKSLGLSDIQRRQLVDVLVKETSPPKKYSQGSQWFHWFVGYQASSIPESRIKPVFDEVQWEIFSGQFVRAKKMEHWLKLNGVLSDDEPAGGERAPEVIPKVPF